MEGNNAFAVDLYGQLRNQDGNLLFSPGSISTALAMTYAGARGDTASEMAKTLQYTLPPERLHPTMGALFTDLNAAHTGYQLRVANAVWAQEGYHFLNEFLKLTKSDYGAGFNGADFKGASEAARLTINQWLGQLRPVPKVVLTLPKFKMTRQFELQDTLGAMGMPQAFNLGMADFSGMTGKRELFISAVIHKAFIDVNEEGTEAAAATAAVMAKPMARAPDRMQPPPPVFRADHPFLFLIRDNRSGGILFMGRLTDPTKQACVVSHPSRKSENAARVLHL